MSPISSKVRLWAVTLLLIFASTGAMAQNQSGQAGAKIVPQGSYGDWRHQCIEQSGGGKECFISQFATSKEAQVRGLVTILRSGKGYAARFEVPIGVYLPAGLALTVDGKDYGVAPFERCFPDRCIAFADLKNETINVLKSGKVATLIVHAAPSQRIFLPISLEGVTAAFRALG
jgi:invasion protein IalB